MTIHVLPPTSEAPAAPQPPEELDPFWTAVRRRRPDLPLVLLGDPSADAGTPGSGSGR